MTNTKLVKKIEALDGPDREIDLLIMRHVMNIGGDPSGAEHYTSSVDAAITLVPTGWRWQVGPFHTDPQKARAQIAEPILTEFGFGIGIRSDGNAKTAPLALCAAAIRARGHHD